MTDIFGNALLDYQNGHYTEDIITFSSLDEKDIIPLPYLFRNFGTMPLLEQKALEMCKGKYWISEAAPEAIAFIYRKKGLTQRPWTVLQEPFRPVNFVE